MSTVSATDLPGMVLQAALALGDHNSKKLPASVTKRVQRAVYYFFSMLRFRNLRKKQGKVTEQDVQVCTLSHRIFTHIECIVLEPLCMFVYPHSNAHEALRGAGTAIFVQLKGSVQLVLEKRLPVSQISYGFTHPIASS